MPRDSTATKEVLLREAERLFARHGLDRVTVREIVQAAGQRNVSALTYHFGSREGLVAAILVRHGDPTDAERGERLAAVGRDAGTRDLVAALVGPYARHLGDPAGRDYLRIVAQLSARFARWDDDRPGMGPWLREILRLLQARTDHVPRAVARERVVALIMLMTAATAERARAIETGRPLPLDEPTFVANLTDVLVAVLAAPLHVPAPAAATTRGTRRAG